MVASLVSATAAVAKTTAVGTAGDCPSTVVEDDATVLWVGCTSYGTTEEHH
jgi:hypothetical protein